MQRRIMEKAKQFMKPQTGVLVYATCSILKEENDEQIDYFVKHLNLEPISKPVGWLPTENGADGFFGAVLKERTTKSFAAANLAT